MTIALLVAGRGTRFNNHIPKCLMDVGGQSLLERTITLIRNNSKVVPILVITGYMGEEVREVAERLKDKNLTVIHNVKFEEDQNILSAQVAIKSSSKEILILEGDCIFNEFSISEFISRMGVGENVFFTKDNALFNRKNAIIKSNNGSFSGYLKGDREAGMEMDGWTNMAGAVLFNESAMLKVSRFLEDSKFESKSTYYFQPLLEDTDLTSKVHPLSNNSMFITFNTQFEYLNSMAKIGVETKISLFNVDLLNHVEGFSKKRVEWLKEKIITEGIWNLPICIDGEYGIVMDGQHRMEVAKSLGLSHIPVLKFTHQEVDFWSLRDNHEVSLKQIIENHSTGNVYPYKTVKYGFPVEVPKCSINLEELR